MGDNQKFYVRLVGEDTLEEMCEMVKTMPEGCVVELGVYQGGSAMGLYKVCEEQKRELYLYDTFTGIPFKCDLDSHNIGDFGDANLELIREMMPKAVIVPGTFPFSVIKMPPIAFAHIDADQYDSIRMAIYVLGPMMVKGGVMWFDDVGCLTGADAAVHEWGHPLEIAKCGKYYARF